MGRLCHVRVRRAGWADWLASLWASGHPTRAMWVQIGACLCKWRCFWGVVGLDGAGVWWLSCGSCTCIMAGFAPPRSRGSPSGWDGRASSLWITTVDQWINSAAPVSRVLMKHRPKGCRPARHERKSHLSASAKCPSVFFPAREVLAGKGERQVRVRIYMRVAPPWQDFFGPNFTPTP